MRAWAPAGAILVLQALAQTQQPAQPPVFRTGIDLLTVDVTVVDGDGRQIADLTPQEFTVEIDGKSRTVVTAEYVKLVDEAAPAATDTAPAPAPGDEAFFSTNVRNRGGGRFILLLVDQGNIRAGAARQMMRSAARFVDALAPGDRVALVAIPGPGVLVDFTTDREKLREGLLTIAGQKHPFLGRFNISLTEAVATVEHSDATRRAQLMMRECGALGSATEMLRCELEVQQEAGEIVMQQRAETQDSLRGIRVVLGSLASIDGPKSVILISEGLVLEGSATEIEALAALAADIRASLDVMLMDVPAFEVTQMHRPTTPRDDRDLQVAGLEAIAGLARGRLHRIAASPDAAFARIARSLAGHYLLAIEAAATERDGRRHRIDVRTSRRGVTINARRSFLAPAAPAPATTAEAVARALAAPLPRADMPVKLATWTYKEPGSPRVRLLVAAEIGRLADQPLEYTSGIAVVDQSGRVVATSVEPRTLEASDLDPAAAVYGGAVTVEPGRYLVRMAFADGEGRVASVERRVDAWQMDGDAIAVGDLVVGAPPPAGQSAIAPSVEPRVQGGLVALMEVYTRDARALERVEGTLEVVLDESTRPLMTTAMRVAGSSSPEARSLQAELATSALPPGRYLARATVTHAGEPAGHLVRPFRVVAGGAAASGSAEGAGAEVPPDIRQALVDSLPAFDRRELLEAAVLAAVLTAAQEGRSATVKAAIDTARKGALGSAALAALEAGDQTVATFLKGLDFFVQAQPGRAAQQLQSSMQSAPTFSPARLYLGACLAEGQRHREAASLLQSVQAALVPGGAAHRLAGEAWLRAGDAALAIESLEKAAAETSGDARTTRDLGLAYVLARRAGEGVTLLAPHIAANPDDQAALVAAIYGVYASHTPYVRSETLAADRARVTTWARAYAETKGPMQGLVDAWTAYLDHAK